MFNTRARIGLVLLAMLPVAALMVGCPQISGNPETDVAGFKQSRHDAELKATIDTLEAKLSGERVGHAVAMSQVDRAREELADSQRARRIEKDQYDVALRLNADLKKKLDEIHSESNQLKTLREDNIRLNKMLQASEAEVADLKAKLAKLQGSH
jgi:predicted nuclease with TOPRIM domain